MKKVIEARLDEIVELLLLETNYIKNFNDKIKPRLVVFGSGARLISNIYNVRVKKIFSENDCNLIEYVAGRICEGILEKYPIQKVVIKIRKPHAPIDADLDTVEVEIERISK